MDRFTSHWHSRPQTARTRLKSKNTPRVLRQLQNHHQTPVAACASGQPALLTSAPLPQSHSHAHSAARLPRERKRERGDGQARQDGLRRDEPGGVHAAAVPAWPPGLLRAQPRRLPPGRPRRRRRGDHPGRVAAPLPLPPPPPWLERRRRRRRSRRRGRRHAPLPGVLHGAAPLLRPAPLRRRRRRRGERPLAPARARRQRRGQRRGRRRRRVPDARRVRGLAVAVLRARRVRVRRRVCLLPARALGRQQVVQASCRRQERGVRVVPHPGRHGPDGRPDEDDVGERDGAAALPQPGHLLQPARHGRAVPPLLRRPHRRLRRHGGVLPAAEERADGDGVRGGEAGAALRRGRGPAQQAQQRPPRRRGGARRARPRAARARPHPRPPRQVQVLPPRALPPPHPRGAPRQARTQRRRRMPVPRRPPMIDIIGSGPAPAGLLNWDFRCGSIGSDDGFMTGK